MERPTPPAEEPEEPSSPMQPPLIKRRGSLDRFSHVVYFLTDRREAAMLRAQASVTERQRAMWKLKASSYARKGRNTRFRAVRVSELEG